MTLPASTSCRNPRSILAVETRYAAELLATSPAGVGYLLKDRVADVSEFVDALTRVAAGGTALDPEVVGQLLSVSRRGDILATLTPREREVLGLMAVRTGVRLTAPRRPVLAPSRSRPRETSIEA